MCRQAWQWHHPGRIDVASARWEAAGRYSLQPDARRYEQYEMSMAAKVHACTRVCCPHVFVLLCIVELVHGVALQQQVGLGVAVQQALSLGVDRTWQRIHMLAGLLRDRLRAVGGVTVHDTGALLCGIVTFTKVRMIALTTVVDHDAVV